ncbi:hypothetical protein CC117_02210 [Parafrankia colletiae]|uniref:Uncharacterized protein n=1 Tax=Parafrankia colletiae TaxID=573497 RepID=A0A1S1RM26_9ACTN|nr:hypothetical protein CC117_02210 [Parafrankia colletiae]
MHLGPAAGAGGQLDDDVVRGERPRDDLGLSTVKRMVSSDLLTKLSGDRFTLLTSGGSTSAEVEPGVDKDRSVAHWVIVA